jgi:ribonuclease HI
MELTAAIHALQMLPLGRTATLFTDSQYVRRGVEEWVEAWQRNGWRTAKKTPVLNKDLWEELQIARQARPLVEIEWVKAHDGNTHNESADRLARAAAVDIMRSTQILEEK